MIYDPQRYVIEDKPMASFISEKEIEKILEKSKSTRVRIREIIYKCLDKNPGHRYQTINELMADLKSFKEPSGDSIKSLNNSLVYFVRSLFKRPIRQNIIRGISVVIVLMLFFFLYQNFNDKFIATLRCHLSYLSLRYTPPRMMSPVGRQRPFLSTLQ